MNSRRILDAQPVHDEPAPRDVLPFEPRAAASRPLALPPRARAAGLRVLRRTSPSRALQLALDKLQARLPRLCSHITAGRLQLRPKGLLLVLLLGELVQEALRE